LTGGQYLSTRKAPAGKQAASRGGGSVADGLRSLLDDLRQGRLSMTDTAAFAPGKNLATTPGKVVYRNRLIELIHYAPMTSQTYAVPRTQIVNLILRIISQ
jgi:polyhydroxyalkanoate synthase